MCVNSLSSYLCNLNSRDHLTYRVLRDDLHTVILVSVAVQEHVILLNEPSEYSIMSMIQTSQHDEWSIEADSTSPCFLFEVSLPHFLPPTSSNRRR
jgi:hypothetical protein